MLQAGHLEAVIGLPPGLFYGTGIPACVLVLNKKDANRRKRVLFINAEAVHKVDISRINCSGHKKLMLHASVVAKPVTKRVVSQ